MYLSVNKKGGFSLSDKKKAIDKLGESIKNSKKKQENEDLRERNEMKQIELVEHLKDSSEERKGIGVILAQDLLPGNRKVTFFKATAVDRFVQIRVRVFTRDQLKAIGRKGETYDKLIWQSVLERRFLHFLIEKGCIENLQELWTEFSGEEKIE